MSFCYRFFGLSAVSNVALPGLVCTSIQYSDLQIVLGHPPSQIDKNAFQSEELTFSSSIETETGEPSFRIFRNGAGTITHLVYHDGMEFWLNATAGNIWAIWSDPLTLGDAASYLLGPVLGLLLRLRGIACLHASAVVLEGRAVLFAGDAGAGKSTTAAAMVRRGNSLLTDDIVAILERAGTLSAASAYPYVSLWPESVEMLYGLEAKVPDFSANFSKRRLSSRAFEHSAVPLGTIFILGERSSELGVPRAAELPMQERLLALVANSYGTSVLDKTERAKEFELFGRMLGSIPVRRLYPHSDPAYLDRLCDVIEQECRRA